MALLVYYLAFLALGFAWPTWRLWRRQRTNAFVLTFEDSAHGVVSKGFALVVLGLLTSLLAALWAPAEAFGPLPWLEAPAIRATGWVLLAASAIVMAVAQAQMGGAWRVGFDLDARPELVTGGLFSRSRNPIFLSMRINLAGLVLAWPNAATLAAALLGEVLMQTQVRLEEDYLQGKLGPTYAAYRARTPRWL